MLLKLQPDSTSNSLFNTLPHFQSAEIDPNTIYKKTNRYSRMLSHFDNCITPSKTLQSCPPRHHLNAVFWLVKIIVYKQHDGHNKVLQIQKLIWTSWTWRVDEHNPVRKKFSDVDSRPSPRVRWAVWGGHYTNTHPWVLLRALLRRRTFWNTPITCLRYINTRLERI